MVPLNPSSEDGTYSQQDLAPYMELHNIKIRDQKLSGRFYLVPIGRYARITGIRHAFVQDMTKMQELNHLEIDKTTFIVVDAERWEIR